MPLRFVRVAFFAFALSAIYSFSQTTAAYSPNDVLPAPPAANHAPRNYHDHSVRDIDAIGDRNVGCGRGLRNWYSLDRQIANGKEYSKQVEATSRMISDSEITEYVNRVGQNLVRNSDSLVAFTIKVIDSDEVNAFALPGGFFYIDSGLILAADDEAELAGVMAHEIAHVAACHAARRRTRGQLMNMASIPLMMIGGPVGYVAYESLAVAKPISFMKFSRQFESEADFLGIQYMYKAGYDPQALTAFFEKIKGFESRKQSGVLKAFQTHPQTPDRIQRSQEEISTLLPAETQYKVDTSEFEDVKARLIQIQNRLRLGNHNRPTLRRIVHAAPDDSTSAQGGRNLTVTSGD